MRLENYTMSLRCAGRVDSASALAHNGKDSGFRLPGFGFHPRERARAPRSRIPNTETRIPSSVYERCYRSSNQVRDGHRAGSARPVAHQVEDLLLLLDALRRSAQLEHLPGVPGPARRAPGAQWGG